MGKIKNAKKLKQPKVDNSRKAQRKQKRLQKKVHRQEHYMKKKPMQEQIKYTPGRFVKRPADDIKPEKVVIKKKTKKQPLAQDILCIEREKELKEANALKSEMEDRRRDILVKANEDEDKLIKKLEKQLGLNKSKNKNNYFADEGLDYLLEICDRSTTEQIVAAEKHLAQVDGDSDFEEDLAAVTGKEITKTNEKRKNDQIDSDDSGKEMSEDEELSEKVNKSKRKRKDDLSEDDEIDNDEFDDDSGQELSEDDDLTDNEDVSDEDHDSYDDIKNMSDSGENSEESEHEEKPSKSQKQKSKKLETESKEAKKLKNESKENKTVINKERIIKAEELGKVFSDDEISHLSGDDDDLEEFGDENGDVDVSKKKEEKPDVWEDIYGRKRDKEGNIIKEEKGVYIPPHLRNKDSSSDKQMAQLKRQIKSVLNKLAATNLHWACTSIESLYSNNSRNSVNTALTQLWLEATVGPSATPDRLVAEHAALVSVLHANVGSEIGAHFIQELVKQFDELMNSPPALEDKTLDNLVACLAQFYNFKIFESPLLLDILGRLLSTLSEKNMDCALVGLRGGGAALRREAPGGLRELLQGVQARAGGGGAASGSRIKFLLEVLMAIKNNNLMKIPNYDPTHQEQLKKMTRTIVRKGNYITPLNIRLEDLLKADERGKWWVVGSAWEGAARDDLPSTTDKAPAYDHKLLELARKQRMNTDVRRSIFCVIMSAEDYTDAFEKLERLGLRPQQRAEVCRVLLACCVAERSPNPYYGALAERLCAADRGHQLSLQFAAWDKIKDIEKQPKQCLANLAQLLTHLIMEKALPLSVLKVIQFSDLNKQSVRFMRQVLLSIIMNENLAASLEVFHRVSKPPKLQMFRKSLRLFIQHFLVKNASKKSNVLSEEEIRTLKERVGEVDRILSMFESKVKF